MIRALSNLICLAGLALMLVACGGSGHSNAGPFTGLYRGTLVEAPFELALTDDEGVVRGGAIVQPMGDVLLGQVTHGQINGTSIDSFEVTINGLTLTSQNMSIAYDDKGDVLRLEGDIDNLDIGLPDNQHIQTAHVVLVRIGDNLVSPNVGSAYEGSTTANGNTKEFLLSFNNEFNYGTGSTLIDFYQGSFQGVRFGDKLYVRVGGSDAWFGIFTGKFTIEDNGLTSFDGTFQATGENVPPSGTFHLTSVE